MTQEEQIALLEQKVNQLEKEVDVLKKHQKSMIDGFRAIKQMMDDGQMVMPKQTSQQTQQQNQHQFSYEPVQSAQPAQQFSYEPVQPAQPMQNVQQMQNAQPMQNVQQTQPAQPVKQAAEKTVAKDRTKDHSMESKIGKNLMGILASVLIFISVACFGVIIYSQLSDIARVGIIMVLSAIFTGIGLWRMKKESKFYAFFTSLAGCGVGAFYIMFILMYFAYEMIPVVGLAIALFLWTVAVAVLAKFKSKVFTYICYAGSTVSVLLCGVQWPGSFLCLGFYLVSMVLIFGASISKTYRKNGFFFIQLPIMALVMTALYEDSIPCILAIIAIVTLVSVIQMICFKLENKDLPVMFVQMWLSFIALIIMCSVFHDKVNDSGWLFRTSENTNYVSEIIFAVALLAITISAYIKQYKEHKSLFYVPYYASVAILPWLTYCNVKKEYLGFVIFFAILLALGTVFKNRHFRYAGFVYLIINTIGYPEKLGYEITFVISLVTVIVMLLWLLKNYDIFDKYFITAEVIIAIMMLCEAEIFGVTITLVLISAISVFMNTKFFHKNPDSDQIEQSSVILGYVINGIMMLFGAVYIKTVDVPIHIVNDIPGTETFAVILVTLVTIGLYFINTKRLYELKVPEMVIGIYICLKFTFLIGIILARLEAVSFVVSVVGLILAIVFIVLGFKLKKKPYRLYGLVLTIICVAKLILFDIKYDSNLLRPVGFFVAGILCFAISYIYSRLEKRESELEGDVNSFAEPDFQTNIQSDVQANIQADAQSDDYSSPEEFVQIQSDEKVNYF